MNQQHYGRLYPAPTAIYGRRVSPRTAIIEGQEFRKTRETLLAKQKELEKAEKGNKTHVSLFSLCKLASCTRQLFLSKLTLLQT